MTIAIVHYTLYYIHFLVKINQDCHVLGSGGTNEPGERLKDQNLKQRKSSLFVITNNMSVRCEEYVQFVT